MHSRWITAALMVVLAASCSSTTFRTTWKAPDAGPVDYAGKKIAAIFISAEESTRRRAEEALARELTSRGAEGLAAYTLVATDQLKDQTTARATLRAAGCSGALVMRVTAREQQISSYPGAYSGMRYSTFSGYSGYGWGMAYDTSYLRTDTSAHDRDARVRTRTGQTAVGGDERDLRTLGHREARRGARDRSSRRDEEGRPDPLSCRAIQWAAAARRPAKPRRNIESRPTASVSVLIEATVLDSSTERPRTGVCARRSERRAWRTSLRTGANRHRGASREPAR